MPLAVWPYRESHAVWVPAFAGTTAEAISRRRRPLWDSYNVGIASVSKTYAPGGTSAWQNAKAVHRLAATTHRNISMLDILMLALAFGFFVAGIGYAYACERL